jgi:hypothetical protein
MLHTNSLFPASGSTRENTCRVKLHSIFWCRLAPWKLRQTRRTFSRTHNMQCGIRSAVNRTACRHLFSSPARISRQLPLRNLWPLYDQKYWKTLRRVCVVSIWRATRWCTFGRLETECVFCAQTIVLSLSNFPTCCGRKLRCERGANSEH